MLKQVSPLLNVNARARRSCSAIIKRLSRARCHRPGPKRRACEFPRCEDYLFIIVAISPLVPHQPNTQRGTKESPSITQLVVPPSSLIFPILIVFNVHLTPYYSHLCSSPLPQ